MDKTVTSPLDFIIETAKTDPIQAGEMMVQSLMAGDPATLKLGYSFGSALTATAVTLGLSAKQTALVAGRVYERLVEAASEATILALRGES